MITRCRKGRFTAKSNKSKKEGKRKGKEGRKKRCQAQIFHLSQGLNILNENFFDFFDCEPKVRFVLAVKISSKVWQPLEHESK
jgi:hypothetical protein